MLLLQQYLYKKTHSSKFKRKYTFIQCKGLPRLLVCQRCQAILVVQVGQVGLDLIQVSLQVVQADQVVQLSTCQAHQVDPVSNISASIIRREDEKLLQR